MELTNNTNEAKIENKLQSLVELLKNNNCSRADIDKVKRAFEMANTAHKGQKRLSGVPYINHPLEATITLAEMQLDIPTIIAGLLHDVPEDTDYNIIDIEKNFGKIVARLVIGVSKLKQLEYKGSEKYSENLRKMFISMAQDVRVIFIKMADRLHNMKTLYYHPKDKQKKIARETLEIYAPIAHRLGMGAIKGQLEDYAFPYVFPEEFKKFQKKVMGRYQINIEFTDEIMKLVREELEEQKIKLVSIHGRTKHLYSLYKKLKRPQYNDDINQIYDLVAIRIIVPDIENCYKVLGLIHKLWKPLPGRIKDYIAQPKLNNYQSLHTSVFGPLWKVIEFQIRTPEMHEIAEYGIAAHWHYKELGKSFFHITKKIHPKGYSLPKKLSWIQELARLQKKAEGSKQFLKELKIDALKDRILVFTPQGDVIDLPDGATPVDFAYYIHSEIGNKCTGVKINEQMARLNSKLQNGDVVEIITSKSRKGPSKDWLRFVKTSPAKSKIKAYFANNEEFK